MGRNSFVLLWVMDFPALWMGEEPCPLQVPMLLPSVPCGRTPALILAGTTPQGALECNATPELCRGRLCWHPWILEGLLVLSSFSLTGVGSVPQVHITGPEEDGVRVVCTASGWFPKPQIQWRAANGEKFLTFSETHAQDTEGLFSVESALVVRDSSSGNMTCSVLNPVLDQKKAMAIFIPGQHYFPFPAGPEGVA